MYYVQLFNLLQIQKTLLLKNLSIKKIARKRYNNNIRLNIFIKSKKTFYQIIQEVFFKFTFLVHYNRTQQLYVNVNVFYERNFDVIVFYV